PLRQLGAKDFGSGSVEAAPVFIDGDLRHYRQIEIHLSRGENRLVQLFQRPECLENYQIDSAFDQRGYLFAEGIARLLAGDFAQRLDAHAQRADCSGYQCLKALGRLPRQPGPGQVDVADLVAAAMAGKPGAAATESVGLNDLGACMQVVLMNTQNQVRLGKVQLVIAAVDEYPL